MMSAASVSKAYPPEPSSAPSTYPCTRQYSAHMRHAHDTHPRGLADNKVVDLAAVFNIERKVAGLQL
jgi:hypothetical protein